jgi:hypothetical protein
MDEHAITALAAALGFGAKALWDWFYARVRERETLALEKRFDFLERQLSLFYWPIHIRLEKDNVVWRRILDIDHEDETKRKIATEIERSVILPNHEEILGILSTQMHLAQAHKKLRAAILQYINHVSVYKALRAVEINDAFPLGRGVGWPHDLFPMIKAQTEQLQAEYDALRTGRRAPGWKLLPWRRLLARSRRTPADAPGRAKNAKKADA